MKLFSFLMVLAMAAVLLVLIVGLFGMLKGGAFNRKYGNRLMRWRVALQALAIILFVCAVATRG